MGKITKLMKLVILPGNSHLNKEWAENASSFFSKDFEDRYVQNYLHWDNEQDTINFEVEAKKLVENIGDTECTILAKSAGAMLAIYCVSKNLIKPRKCIFVGLPVIWAKERNFDLEKWIQNFDIPTIVIQNSNDPVTSYAQAKSFLDALHKENIEIREIHGDDHTYDNFEIINNN